MRTMPFRAYLVFCLFSVIGCKEVGVSQRDIAATWAIAAESRNLLAFELSSASTVLLLESDGTFNAVDLPGELLYVRKPARNGLVTGSGHWAVKGDKVMLDFTEMSKGGEQRVPYRTSMWIEGNQESPRLYYFSGDPDEGRRIYFVRRT